MIWKPGLLFAFAYRVILRFPFSLPPAGFTGSFPLTSLKFAMSLQMREDKGRYEFHHGQADLRFLS